jgi:hypothetical protein
MKDRGPLGPAAIMPVTEDSQGVGRSSPGLQEVTAETEHATGIFQVVSQASRRSAGSGTGHEFECPRGDLHAIGKLEDSGVSVGSEKALEQLLQHTVTAAAHHHQLVLLTIGAQPA